MTKISKEHCDNCNNEVCCCIIRTQETLEEAAERYEETDFNVTPTVETSQMMIQRAFIEGAKWQQERMYSEEEVLGAFDAGLNYMKDGKLNKKQWFEQFKKK